MRKAKLVVFFANNLQTRLLLIFTANIWRVCSETSHKGHFQNDRFSKQLLPKSELSKTAVPQNGCSQTDHSQNNCKNSHSPNCE